jgi:hypothetical protein
VVDAAVNRPKSPSTVNTDSFRTALGALQLFVGEEKLQCRGDRHWTARWCRGPVVLLRASQQSSTTKHPAPVIATQLNSPERFPPQAGTRFIRADLSAHQSVVCGRKYEVVVAAPEL